MTKKIESLEQLKRLAENQPIECSISLDHGARTSTTIQYFPTGFSTEERDDISIYKWDVFLGVCDMYLEIEDDEELEDQTHIVEAIRLGALNAI